MRSGCSGGESKPGSPSWERLTMPLGHCLLDKRQDLFRVQKIATPQICCRYIFYPYVLFFYFTMRTLPTLPTFCSATKPVNLTKLASKWAINIFVNHLFKRIICFIRLLKYSRISWFYFYKLGGPAKVKQKMYSNT